MLTLLASFAQEESRSISDNVKWGTRKRFEKGIPNGRFNIYGYRWDGDHLVIHEEEAAIVRLIYDDFMKGLSAETTEKKLAAMGVKSYKGQHFGNTSIRQILSNITYTGNLLFQKEYTTDPIEKKTRKNRGELPQYWVENTHEAIIPMEVYQAVQNEKARRRELGVFANWSIQTSCFTGKIKCGHCGASYVRNTRKNKAMNPLPTDPEMYTTYGCGTRKKKGQRCPGKDIREEILRKKCAEVLGLAEFDEEAFNTQVEKIIVPEHGILMFHMTDGRIIPIKWESTAKKDSWTPERRAAKGRITKELQSAAHSTCFTSRIRCELCGENYRRQRSKRVGGSFVSVWRCAKSAQCDSLALPETTLQDLAANAMGLTEFSENAFREQIAYVGVIGVGRLVFHFHDGRTAEAEWKNKRTMPPHSEERKAAMSQKMKENWRKRRGESNDHPGNDQPIHGSAD